MISLGRHHPKLKRSRIVGLVLLGPVAHIVRQTSDEQVAEGILRRRVVVNVGKTTEELDSVVSNVRSGAAALVVAGREVGKMIQKEVEEVVLGGFPKGRKG